MSHDIVKKSVRDPITRALLQVFWDTLRDGGRLQLLHLPREPQLQRRAAPGQEQRVSWALSLGHFSGGELICETEGPRTLACHDTKRRPVIFDGARPHWVTPYEGKRYSAILNTSKDGRNLDSDQSDLA